MEQTTEGDRYSVRPIRGLYEVYVVSGGVVPKELRGRFTEELRGKEAIDKYIRNKVLMSYPTRIKAKTKDPRKPGRKPLGPKKDRKGANSGTSKDDNTVQ